MFQLFKKKEKSENDDLLTMITMVKPFLKIKGVDLDTIIPNAAAMIVDVSGKIGGTPMLMLGINEAKDGLKAGVYLENAGSMQLMFDFEFKSLPEAIDAVQSIISLMNTKDDVSATNNTEPESGTALQATADEQPADTGADSIGSEQPADSSSATGEIQPADL